jgi:hypothetical protein
MNPWPKSSGPSSGYLRQNNSSYLGPNDGRGPAVDFGLRSDIGKDAGGTTVIGGADLDLESRAGMGKGMWSNSASKLTEISSDEDRDDGSEHAGWNGGITKITVSTQVAH